MDTALRAAPGPAVDARDAAPATPRPTRPFYWSLRRELWENRSIYLAPTGVAVFVVVGLVIHALTMPSHMPGMLGTASQTPGSVSIIYRGVVSLMLAAAFVVGAFYCLEALSAERRDRSILFWKSLPVSDRTAVLAKATVPLVVLPAVTLVMTVVTHVALLLLSVLALAVQGQSAAPLWRELALFRMWGALLYAVPVMALWHAPVYGFLLLVSGWARRTAVLWVVLPLLALALLEKLTMDTLHVVSAVSYRLFGGYVKGFAVHGLEAVPFSNQAYPSPGRLMVSPDLWIGLVLAAVFAAAAIRMRRYREPV
jgi:ABC-2 type transport system permease protein